MTVLDVAAPFLPVGVRGSDVWHLVHADGPATSDMGQVTLCARRTRAICEPSSILLCRLCAARSKESSDPPPRPGAARTPYRHLPGADR